MSDEIYPTNGFYHGANLITEIYFSRILIAESYTNITDLLSFNKKLPVNTSFGYIIEQSFTVSFLYTFICYEIYQTFFPIS